MERFKNLNDPWSFARNPVTKVWFIYDSNGDLVAEVSNLPLADEIAATIAQAPAILLGKISKEEAMCYAEINLADYKGSQ